MTFEEFKVNIEKSISSMVDENYLVYTDSIIKNNGTILDGLVISNPNINIAPTIYLNPYYGRYLDGCSMKEIIDDIYTSYSMHLPEENFDLSFLESFETSKDKIIMKLINYKENSSFLETVPHVEYLDMAIIFQYMIEMNDHQTGTITINNKLFKRWKISLVELEEIAMENTPKLLPYTLNDILDYLPEFVSNREYIQEGRFFQMLILTNNKKLNGATVLLYKNLLKQIADEYDKNLLLIPSSIHEVLLIPTEDNDDTNMEYFNSLIEEVNYYELADEEVLSSHAYFYSREKACLM